MIIIFCLKNCNPFPNTDCFYEDWGHTGICQRRKIIPTNVKPTLQVLSPESYHVQMFELLFMKEYLRDVILKISLRI